jgi:hypothetical protein
MPDLFTKWGGNGDWKTIDEDLGNFSYHIYLQLQRDAPQMQLQKS